MAQNQEESSSQIADIAGLLVTVDFIKANTEEIKKAVHEQNGKVDELCVSMAVMDEWRRTHDEKHHEIQEKQRKMDWVERIATGFGIVMAAVVGVLKDG
jgi:hypothetical protein